MINLCDPVLSPAQTHEGRKQKREDQGAEVTSLVHERTIGTVSSAMTDYTGGSDDVDVPFESARQNADRLGINYGALPHLPFWSRMFGQSSEDYHTKVAAKIMTSSAGIGRELTQPEKDAMAHHL